MQSRDVTAYQERIEVLENENSILRANNAKLLKELEKWKEEHDKLVLYCTVRETENKGKFTTF